MGDAEGEEEMEPPGSSWLGLGEALLWLLGVAAELALAVGEGVPLGVAEGQAVVEGEALALGEALEEKEVEVEGVALEVALLDWGSLRDCPGEREALLEGDRVREGRPVALPVLVALLQAVPRLLLLGVAVRAWEGEAERVPVRVGLAVRRVEVVGLRSAEGLAERLAVELPHALGVARGGERVGLGDRDAVELTEELAEAEGEAEEEELPAAKLAVWLEEGVKLGVWVAEEGGVAVPVGQRLPVPVGSILGLMDTVC